MATAYTDAFPQTESDGQNFASGEKVSIDMGWIAKQWSIFFVIAFVVFYIPITLNIKKFITPIRQAARYSDSLAHGNLKIEVIKDRTDEIGILQESIHNLVLVSRKQAELIKSIADGDLSGCYSPLSADDVVGQSLVQMLEHNNDTMAQIAAATNQLLVVAQQIADSSQDLANGATEQAASVEELSSSVAEVSHTAHNNAVLAGKASDLGSEIMKNAEKGSSQMKHMLDAVSAISDASHDINKVIKVIDDIAFQTNILALNASVEAARAGIHGKGFAVVAEEVRNLANKSAEAARNSGILIANSMEKTELGTRIANETATSLSEIVDGIQKSSQIISNIADSNAAMDVSISQITNGMEQVSQVVQRNSATAEEAAACSSEMNSQSHILQSMVAKFKLAADSKSHSH